MELISLLISLGAFTYVIATCPVRGVGRFLAPDVMATAMIVAIFGVRPTFKDRFEEGPWYDMYVPTVEGQHISLLVGVIAIVSFSIGTTIAQRTTRREARLDQFRSCQSTKQIRFTAGQVIALSAISAFTYVAALTAFAGPGIFSQLQNGRSADLAIGGIPEIVMIIPLTASVAAAIFLLTHKNRRLLAVEIIVLLMATITSVTLVSQLGNRRFIIPAVLIPLTAALIRKPARVKLIHIGLATVGVLLLATIPMVRAAGARRPGEGLLSAGWRYLQEEGPSGVIRPIFVSYDTEMFDYIAVVAPTLESDRFGWGRGTVVEFITRPLPATWIDGPAWSNSLMTQFFGGGCGDPVCPVASLPGVLYFDGGLTLVAVGSLIAGIFLRILSAKWQYNKLVSIKTQISVVIISSFALIAIRTNTIHAAWWVVYSLMIAYAVYAVATVNLNKIPVRRALEYKRSIALSK